MPFLLPSRFVPSDRLSAFACREFGDLPKGQSRVTAICNWLYNNIDYRRGSSNEQTTADESLLLRAGVCRDFAHLGIAFCRALNIPARFVSCYAYGLEPRDFHAVFEAYLDGRWWLFDGTRQANLDGLVRIGVGRTRPRSRLRRRLERWRLGRSRSPSSMPMVRRNCRVERRMRFPRRSRLQTRGQTKFTWIRTSTRVAISCGDLPPGRHVLAEIIRDRTDQRVLEGDERAAYRLQTAGRSSCCSSPGRHEQRPPDLEQHGKLDALDESPEVTVVAAEVAIPAPARCVRIIASGLPSGVSLRRPRCASSDPNVCLDRRAHPDLLGDCEGLVRSIALCCGGHFLSSACALMRRNCPRQYFSNIVLHRGWSAACRRWFDTWFAWPVAPGRDQAHVAQHAGASRPTVGSGRAHPRFPRPSVLRRR